MPCTTILAGKLATYNGSTMISRNDDSQSGVFTRKCFQVILPDRQPREYHSVLSHLRIDLPDNPMAYTAIPNPDPGEEGIWAAAGANTANVAMSATETLSTNARVLAADPYVQYQPAQNGLPEVPGGIGEEDMVSIVLPYITSAKDGVRRLGSLLERYGTYEPNGIAFSDADDVWYMETIGGHHWIARRLPDDCYSVIANQFSLDTFDLDDALGAQKNYMASADLRSFIEDNHLDLSVSGTFNARLAFGSATHTDHIYNTPRVWYGQKFFSPKQVAQQPQWEFSPFSNSLPWCRKADFKITVEDVKTVLSSVYEGTEYDPYLPKKPDGILPVRPIGINRTSTLALLEICGDLPDMTRTIEWLAFGSNAYNAFIPLFTQIHQAPDYLSWTPRHPSTESFYWANRLAGALADGVRSQIISSLERYQEQSAAQCRSVIDQTRLCAVALQDPEQIRTLLEGANQTIADIARKQTNQFLNDVLYQASMQMKNRFSLSDR